MTHKNESPELSHEMMLIYGPVEGWKYPYDHLGIRFIFRHPGYKKTVSYHGAYCIGWNGMSRTTVRSDENNVIKEARNRSEYVCDSEVKRAENSKDYSNFQIRPTRPLSNGFPQ